MEEYIDVLDQFGNPTGISKTRSEIHKNGDYHRVVHTWIYNEVGEILLQKRSYKQENHPGCWDISSAGHVHALEKSYEAAVREIKEELGLAVNKEDLKFIMAIKRNRNVLNQELADIYVLEKNVDCKKLEFIDKEVIDAKFFSISQIKKFLENPESNVVNREEYAYLFKYISLEKGLHL
ncbi:MAG: NUDIX domain-containing protein [Bacilli bacterium]|nr:NUDIX domain-containing protein [Bacilli bacterium]